MMIGTMTDASTLADRLATMPDSALPRLAQQYKTDAITLSLILGEKNRRDRVRQSMQAQAAGQPQPKVNDQIVASMQQPAPGIAGLPAPIMQGMADGGIAGYAEGGEVEGYNGDTGSLVAGPITRQMVDQAYQDWMASQPSWFQQKTPMSTQREAAAKSRYEQILQAYQSQPSNVQPGARSKTAGTPQEMAAFDAATDLYMAERAAKKAATGADTKTDTGKPAPKVDTGRRGAAPAKEPVTDPFSLESLRAEQEAAMRPLQLQQGELRNRMVGLRSQMERQPEEALARRKKEIEEEGDVYAGRTERIKARETDLLKQKDTNTGLALLNAGLAIMSTPGSLGQAIGKGARVGTEQYAAGLDKLRAAQEKLEEAKDRTEELRMNRSDMNKREIRQMERDRDAAYLAGSKLFYDFTKSEFDMSRQDTNTLLTNVAKGRELKFEQAGRERVAQIQASAARQPAAQVQIAERLMQENPKLSFAEALQQAVSTQREPMTREKALQQWMQPGAAQMIQAQYPNIKTFDDYWAAMSPSTGAAPAGGGGDGFRVVGVR